MERPIKKKVDNYFEIVKIIKNDFNNSNYK